MQKISLTYPMSSPSQQDARAQSEDIIWVQPEPGVRIEVLTQGEGPVLVLLPSLGRGARDLTEIADPLCTHGFRVVRPEPRGNGGSTGPLEGKTLHDWAHDIAAVIEHVVAGPVVVIGHAHGNWIARTLASDRPELVRGVVLLAGSAGKVPKSVDALPIPSDIRASIEISGDTRLSDGERLPHLQRVFFAPDSDASVWLGGWNTHLLTMQTLAQKRTPVDDYFFAGGVPILNVQAAHDAVAPPRYAGVLREYLGDQVTDRMIANAGHALLPEQPEAVVGVIIEWLRALTYCPTDIAASHA